MILKKKKIKKTSQENDIQKKENTTKNVKKKLLQIKIAAKKKNDIKSVNKNYKNKKDNILALKEQDFMNRMINTPIMKQS